MIYIYWQYILLLHINCLCAHLSIDVGTPWSLTSLAHARHLLTIFFLGHNSSFPRTLTCREQGISEIHSLLKLVYRLPCSLLSLGEGNGPKIQEFWKDFISLLSLASITGKLNLKDIHEDDVQLLQDSESGPFSGVPGYTRRWGKMGRRKGESLKAMFYYFMSNLFLPV